jgi:hypothetical protein
MTIKARRKRKLEIDLNGPDGNAFVLLGMTKDLTKQLGLDPKPILDDMMSDDYDHLIEVFDSHFGDYIDLVR